MGVIADELEHSTILPLKAIMASKPSIHLAGHHFTAPPLHLGPTVVAGGPLIGVAQVEAPVLYQQLEELAKALVNVAKAVRKLEDESNKPRLGPIIGAHRRR